MTMEDELNLDESISAISREALHNLEEESSENTSRRRESYDIDTNASTHRRFGVRLSNRRSSMPTVQNLSVSGGNVPLRKIMEERDSDEVLQLQQTGRNDDDTSSPSEIDPLSEAANSPFEMNRRDTKSRSSSIFSNTFNASGNSTKQPKSSDRRVQICFADEIHHMDYNSHKLFVQMDLLDSNQIEWRPYARWIKYEETMEVQGKRYSKPKVSCLTFHGLLQLRQLISHGCASVDLLVEDFGSALNAAVDSLLKAGVITNDVNSQMLTLMAARLPQEHSTRRRSTLLRAFTREPSSSRLFSDYYISNRPRGDSTLSNGNNESLNLVSVPKPTAGALDTINEDDDLSSIAGSRSRGRARTTSVLSAASSSERRRGTLADIFLSKNPSDTVENDMLKRLPPDSEGALVLVGSVNFVPRPVTIFVRLCVPVNTPKAIQVPVPLRFLFILLTPTEADTEIDAIEIGRSFSTLLANKRFRDYAYEAQEKNDLLRGINEFMDDSIVLPPGEWEKDRLEHSYSQIRSKSHVIKERRRALTRGPLSNDMAVLQTPKLLARLKSKSIEYDPFARTGDLFGGMKIELKRRYTHYVSDWTDGFNLKCITSIFFLFLTCLFPALTFGAILSQETHGMIGVTETQLATSIGGIVFAILSTQPMMLIGACGPMLIFEESVFMFCSLTGYSFMELRIWISAWALIAGIVAVAFEGTMLIHYVTRYSDDIMTVLISFMYVYDSVKFLKKMFTYHPVMPAGGYCLWYNAHNESEYADQVMFETNRTLLQELLSNKEKKLSIMERYTHSLRNFSGDPQPNAALLCCVLLLGTCIVAFVARSIRFSKYFGRQFRMAIGDLGLSLAVVIMLVIDWVVFHERLTPKLQITSGVKPTLDREWFIQPFPFSDPLILLIAFLPGCLLFMILFIETEVTEMIIANHENKLKKGTGYHFDLLLLSIMNAIGSMFGFPWLCALPVRSSEHLSSLTTYQLRAPGQKPKVLGALEQRFTGAILHLLIGLTLMATETLRAIPVAVMFGVFLYLGLISTSGIQMLTRTILFFVPAKYHPHDPYCTKVNTIRMHLFTVIQLICFLIVLSIKSIKATAFSFPLAILGCILFRQFGLVHIFTEQELNALDDHGGSDNEEENSEDMYGRARNRRISSMYVARRQSTVTGGRSTVDPREQKTFVRGRRSVAATFSH